MLLITYLGSGYLYTGELSNITLRIEILNFYYVFTCILYFIDLKGLCCVYKKYFQVRLGFFFNKFGELDPLDFFTQFLEPVRAALGEKNTQGSKIYVFKLHTHRILF